MEIMFDGVDDKLGIAYIERRELGDPKIGGNRKPGISCGWWFWHKLKPMVLF